LSSIDFNHHKVLRRIFGLKNDEVTGGWRKVHNKFYNLYSSPNILRMIKLRRMRSGGHVARRGRSGMHIGFWEKAGRKETTRKI
jgi:hypothetical protein